MDFPSLPEYGNLVKPVSSDIGLLEEQQRVNEMRENETDALQKERLNSLSKELGYLYLVSQYEKLSKSGVGDSDPVRADQININVQVADERKQLVERMSRVNKRCDSLEQHNRELRQQLAEARKQLKKAQAERKETEGKERFCQQEVPDSGANEEMVKELERTVKELKEKWAEREQTDGHRAGGDSDKEQRILQENEQLRKDLDELRKTIVSERTRFEEWQKEFESQKVVIENQGAVISGFLKILREYGSRLGKDVTLIEEREFGRHMADKNAMPVLRCIAEILEAINEQ